MRQTPSRVATLAAIVISLTYCLANAFCPTPIVYHTRSSCSNEYTFLSAASTGEESSPENLPTLYDILGASQTDSYQVLRRKYTTLAKKMHPDANPTEKRLDTVTEFTQVVAAWRVLADPKERLKYDRSLKAKEFTASMEQFLDQGIRTAIPFMKKSVNNTMAAVETSSKTINAASQAVGKVSQRVGNAMDLIEIDRKALSLEQQATRELQQVERLKNELANLDKKRLDMLMDSSRKLSSIEALRILESFNNIQDTSRARKDIEALRNMEQEYKVRAYERQDFERAMTRAERSVENALAQEKLAQARLQEAQRLVLQAKSNVEESLKAQREATAKEKTALNEMEKASLSLEKNAEKVRSSLRMKESESLQEQASFLKKESLRLEDVARRLRSKAEKLKSKSNLIKREKKEN